jgi:Cu/Ag efflux protein CusF
MRTRTLLFSACASVLLAAGALQAQTPAPRPGAAATATHLAVGTVRSVDAATRTLLIAHQAIESLHMGAMTMPFQLADGVAMPDLRAGDSVAFVLAPSAQGLAVTSVQKVALASAQPAGRGGERAMSPGMHHGMGDMGSMMAMMEQCQEMMNRK